MAASLSLSDSASWCSCWSLLLGALPLLVLLVWRAAPKRFSPGVLAQDGDLAGGEKGASLWARRLPFFGHLFYLVASWNTIAVHFLRVARKREWRTTVFAAPNFGGLGGGLVLLTKEASVKHILKDNFDNYEKGPRFREWFSDFLGSGIFASDGKIWKHHRKVASHMFSQRLLKHTLGVGYDVSEKMIARLKQRSQSGGSNSIATG